MAKFILNKKQKYQPNVSDFLAVCGRNYAHILKWLPEQINVNEPWKINGKFGMLSINLIENTKYTQLVEISRPIPNGHFFKSPKVIVRVYHDAQLAEVLTSQQIYRLKPVYDYPNIHMHHSDEKFQVNAFLEELLKIGSLSVTYQS
ncbi:MULTISPECIES: DUF1249 domain-containing protein [Shewanella]|uniref:DUF1249 domain-containing protein n=1 Tax=Shewanella polaris TaxID=2588449 RepID=A0A4Y5YJ78_9GAMM|nr:MULTISPECIES: DUF1249 domain-containing protein [Shewanella]QDE32559.1 DUF1249 domain-containing protein [Shewanella polaris]